MKLYWVDKSTEPGFPPLYIDLDNSNGTVSISRLYTFDEMSQDGKPLEFATPVISVNNNAYYLVGLPYSAVVVFNLEQLRTKWGRGPYDMQSWIACMSLRTNYLVEAIPTFRFTSSSLEPIMFAPVYDKFMVASFNVPFSNSAFSDCSLFIGAPDVVLAGDIFEIINVPNDGAYNKIAACFPSVILTSHGKLTPTRPATVIAQVVDQAGIPVSCEMELFFENVNGQLSHNRRVAVAGSGWTKVSAPNMDIGDTVRVKVGTKFVSGMSDISLLVESD